MTRRLLWTSAILFSTLVICPGSASAQYRNKAFGFDVAYELIQRPPITDDTGTPLPIGSRGDRLGFGIRFGGEGSFKLHHDHWWFSARPLISIFRFFDGGSKDSFEAQADSLANLNLGTMLGLGALAGVRYYFLTDHFRPYLQLSISYEHIFSFGGSGSATCSDTVLCSQGGSYGDNFLPHNNIFAVHATPSFEIFLVRDLALHVMLDYQRWIVFNGYGNNVFTFGLGVLFYG